VSGIISVGSFRLEKIPGYNLRRDGFPPPAKPAEFKTTIDDLWPENREVVVSIKGAKKIVIEGDTLKITY